VPAFRASQPSGEVLLANRGHLLSRLTFPSENHHRAGHTGRLREATLADMGRCRMGFGHRTRDRPFLGSHIRVARPAERLGPSVFNEDFQEILKTHTEPPIAGVRGESPAS
jgi:hypothetical protein